MHLQIEIERENILRVANSLFTKWQLYDIFEATIYSYDTMATEFINLFLCQFTE